MERLSNRNKFVYYRLTEKGKDILDLLMSVAVAFLSSYVVYLSMGSESVVGSYERIAADTGPITTSTNIYVAMTLAFIFIFVIVFFLVKIFRLKSSHF